MKLRFGMRLDGWMKPSACVELAQEAEACGLDSIWFAENPYGRGVFPTMTASGLATKKIAVGIGVLNPFQRHPTLIAMEMGAMDELLGGRTNLGIGAGIPRKLKQADIDMSKPIAAMRDAITIIRDLMNKGRSDHRGQVFSTHDLAIEFTPVRPDYPIYMAAMGDQAIRLAGRVADGLMISNLCTPDFTKRALQLIAENSDAGAEGRLRHIVQYAPCVAGPDRKAARDHAKDVVGRMIKESFGTSSSPVTRNWHVIGSGLHEEYFMDIAGRLDAGHPGRDIVSDTVLDLFAIAGNADDCLAAYERYQSVGVTEMVVTFRGNDPVTDMAYLADALRNQH
jgi:5,10-methylenetetrahydromethanopterin reductase